MRTGSIKINKDLYLDMIKDNKALAKSFFNLVLPLQINWSWDSVELIGVSDGFDEVSEGEVTPVYTATITDLGGEEYFILFTRVKN